MGLNLILDPWIPVRRGDRSVTIRPDQIAETGLIALDWPRPDFNLACLELLIGLVYLAAPPESASAWQARKPDPEALRAALAPLAPAFELLGEGPRFLQDKARLEGDPSTPDMLFIDSAGESTASKNADLMVKRKRYPALDFPLAAMALYTLQAFAPSGGAGNRTSMRGGGPLVTLVKPSAPGEAPLWSLIWANVPCGRPLTDLIALPWMRATQTSEAGQLVHQPEGEFPAAEVFFGMPRRLRLVAEEGRVTGVIQRPYGTNYGLWQHPLTPYYAMKAGADRLPVHPKPGPQSYRHWLGISLAAQGLGKDSLRWRASALENHIRRSDDAYASVIAGGWAMSNMSPQDFLWSEQPLFPFGPESPEAGQAADLVAAADVAARALMKAATTALGLSGSEGTPIEPQRERFFLETESAFRDALRAIVNGQDQDRIARNWLALLRHQALTQFDVMARPVDYDATAPDITPFSRRPTMKTLVQARQNLLRTFSGNIIHDLLGLERPERKKL
ncbi:type I-E CRISPR-associated protein Cse1/CasA [Xanthobacter sp. TB0139]|uniref:type I-E CRISPR-associated protein Cse1/CasA n=1 Tax=Xanthobacter sp. TB0139 TaxID=3459178 RepID=UPI004039461A